jgi:nitroimidazol reductase NimA-like FMN-containing flavoprotein (pyridoxamine 5'-phosphate oxidase superfamily)
MFSEMRRNDRAMQETDTRQLLETAQVGTLATVSEDHTPYAVPMSFAYVPGVIYFHCAPEGKKLNNLRHNASVCFTVADAVELLPAAFSTKYKSAIVFGRMTVIDDPEEKRQGLIALIKKYSPDYYESGLQYIDRALAKTTVLKLEISHMSGKARQ